MEVSARLGLPYLAPQQSQKHVTVNESLRKLDAIVQLVVVSDSTTAQPGSPADGDTYILPAGKTGAQWGTMTNLSVAYYVDGAWSQLTPREGWRAWVADINKFCVYNGASWIALAREKLTANRTYYVRTVPATVTISIASPGVVTWTAHGLLASDPVVFTTTDTLPTGLVAGTVYYVVGASITADTFEVSATPGGASINTSGTQAGTHSAQTGNDSNDGLAQTRAGALLSLQKAWDLVAALDLVTFAATIQAADGLYTAGVAVNKAPLGGSGVTIVGNSATPSNCKVSVSVDCFAFTVPLPATVTVDGFHLKTTGASKAGVAMGPSGTFCAGQVNVKNIVCNGNGGGFSGFFSAGSPGAKLVIASGITIDANMSAFVSASAHGVVQFFGQTVTISGTPAWSWNGFVASNMGLILVASSGVTFSGAATGNRYSATGLSLINSSGGGATYLPGDVAGSVASGGVYA